MSVQPDNRPPLLLLVHRLPYPPNKGDKVRSFHLMQHLAKNWSVFLGTFVDLPEDWQYLPELSKWCADSHVEGINPKIAKVLALRGLLTGEAMSLPYYRSKSMQTWVDETIAREGIRHSVVFSSPMAQYIADKPEMRRVIDFCDVDSAKWTRYADDHRGPMAWLYRREGACLAQFERRIGMSTDASVLVSEAEADLFRSVAPEAASRTHAINNGVNFDFFSPDAARPSPYAADEPAVVFSGAMDYWPNIDAAVWFAKDIWPQIKARHPTANFYVVGMNPSDEVRALGALPGVTVTGTVPDVRPYVQHAAVVVAPLRIARGIQNKVLEGMAMARPVLASSTCAQGLKIEAGVDILLATEAKEYVAMVDDCLSARIDTLSLGVRARERVQKSYSWDAHLSKLDDLLV